MCKQALTVVMKYFCQRVLWKPAHEDSQEKHHNLSMQEFNPCNYARISNHQNVCYTDTNLDQRLQKLVNQQSHWTPNCIII